MPAQWRRAWASLIMRGASDPLVLGEIGRSVGHSRGLRQGRVESMLIFVLSLAVGLKDLVEGWKASDVGFGIGDVWLGILDYADDMFVCARSLIELQLMLGQLERQLIRL
eukprot:177200-Karenia_brevis.AAC.1